MKGVRYSLEEVRSGLARHGAMFWDKGGAPEVDFETLFAHALRHAHDSPTLAQTLPVVLWHNRNRLSAEALVQRARSLHEERTLGFLLDLVDRLSGDHRFGEWARPLYSSQSKEVFFFSQDGDNPWSRALAQKNAPAEARRWGFLMNMDFEAFASHFAKSRRAAA